MNYSLKQIYNALNDLCVVDGDKTPVLKKINEALTNITQALAEMDNLSVRGRVNCDTLLGCIMALESIAEKGGGE